MRVVVAGGDDALRARVRAMLKEIGIGWVTEVGNGGDGLESIKGGGVHCVVLLRGLPDMDAFEFLAAECGMAAAERPPVVVVLREKDRDGAELLSAGAMDTVGEEWLGAGPLAAAMENAMMRKRLEGDRIGVAKELEEGSNFIKRVLDGLFAFVGVLAPDGTMIEVNQAPLMIAGLEPEDVIGKKFWDCHWWSHSAESREGLRNAWRAALQGETARYDVQVRTIGEGRLWIDFQLAPLTDEHGQITHLIPSGMDISERRAVEMEMRDSERKLRAIHDGTHEFMGLVRPDGMVVEANRASLEFGNAQPEDVMGRRFWEGVWFMGTPGAPEKIRRAVEEAAKGGQVAMVMELVAADGGTRNFDLSFLPIKDDTGRVIYIVPEGRDITALRKAEEALRESEESFRNTFENVSIGLAHVGLDGSWLKLNEAVCSITGYDEKDLLDLTFMDITHPDDLDGDLDLLNRLLSGEIPSYSLEKRYVRKGGATIWVHIAVSVMRSDAGEAQYYIASVEDISKRRAIRETLAESEERFRQVFENAGTGIAITDSTGRLEISNPAYQELLGYSSEELAELECFDLIHPDDKHENMRLIKSLLRGERPNFEIENRYMRKDGDAVWVRKFVSIMRAGDRGRVSLVALVSDVSKRRKAEEDLREIAQRKDEFLAMLGHELRNPLAAIRYAVRARAEREDDTGMRMWAEGVIDRQSQQLAAMVDDLLDVARITRGRIDLRMEDVDVCEVLKNTIDAASPLFRRKGQVFLSEMPKEGLWVKGDNARLEQIFGNLLNNAAKYTHEGGRVVMRAVAENGWLVVEVSDDGTGIEAKILPQLFDIFRQAETTLDRAEGGLGIGLTVVQSLVELHGGTISAESEGRGTGSKFTVRLPSAKAVAGRVGPGKDREAPQVVASRRVLVVDDHVDAALGLSRLLAMHGMEVRVAHDGGSALEMADEFDPEIFLLDLGLPVINGYELAERLRKIEKSKARMIVAISGYAQESDFERSKAAGFDHHFAKPLKMELLLDVIRGGGEELENHPAMSRML